VINTKGEESIARLDTGARIKFVARSTGSGLGFSGDGGGIPPSSASGGDGTPRRSGVLGLLSGAAGNVAEAVVRLVLDYKGATGDIQLDCATCLVEDTPTVRDGDILDNLGAEKG